MTGSKQPESRGAGPSPQGETLPTSSSTRDLEEELRREATELKIRLAAIVESSDDAIVSKTLEGIITTWNQGAEKMFGYSAEEALGNPVTMLIPPELQHEEPSILARLRRNEPISHYETVRVRKDGSRINVSLTVSPVKGADGLVIGASKIARDITERKKAEAALQEETRILEVLKRTSELIASQLELPVLLQLVTDAATELSGAEFGAFFYNSRDEGAGYHPQTLSGTSRDAFQNLGQSWAAALVEPTFQGTRPVRVDDVSQDSRYSTSRLREMPDGRPQFVSLLTAPVISRSSGVIGGLFFGHSQPGVFTERTERIVVGIAAQAAVGIDNARLYEEMRRAASERKTLLDAERSARSEAERASLMKDEFLAMLSHELRTPLSAILGWSQVLQMSENVPPTFAEGLETIIQNARVQTRLIDDLLDMNRIISGKIRLDVQTTDLSRVVDEAVNALRPTAEAKGIRLREIVDPLAGPVSGDPARLQQVVWNLLANAIKFTPKQGKVDVLVERVNSHVEITVHDSGEGIAPELLPHIFERFRQGDSSITRRHGGLGLGLSIVKQLIELHGGSVRAKSPGLGQGATFTVTLPIAPVHQKRGEHPLTSRSTLVTIGNIRLDGIRVLVVDDEPDSAALVQRVLSQCKAHVMTARSADEALRTITGNKFDVIVSDIGMPEKDGYQFMREVRKLDAGNGGTTPAIALTAFARSEDRTRAMLAGYHVHVAKPIEPQELVATVASLAGRMNAEDE